MNFGPWERFVLRSHGFLVLGGASLPRVPLTLTWGCAHPHMEWLAWLAWLGWLWLGFGSGFIGLAVLALAWLNWIGLACSIMSPTMIPGNYWQ